MPGSGVLYAIYAIGLVAALMTAIYMTRMMLYTFHGPNRTGATEETHLHEVSWVMTGPLVVLGILTVAGGWLNLPRVITDMVPLGRAGVLDHWLEPAVGNATARLSAGASEIPVATEQLLMLLAVLIAVAGIAFAISRLKPVRLVPKRDAPAEEGFERVVANKYYVDEGIDDVVVRPTYAFSKSFLWRFVDAGVIDGLLVNGSAAVARGFGWVGSRLQTGNVGVYAWVLVVGVVALLGAFTLR
jgi:NADH-quinone oxidoreductase subunit L